MSSSPAHRPRLPWQAVAVATVLATLAAIGVFVVLDDDSGTLPPAATDTEMTLTPTDDGPALVDPDGSLDVAFTTVDGGTATLAGVIEGPTVVNLFASWCPPCIAEMPEFERVSRELAGSVTFFGLAVQDRPEDAEKIVSSTGITYGWGRDVRGDVAGAVGTIQMPTTMFIDADGRIVHLQSGALDARRLRALITEHLGVET